LNGTIGVLASGTLEVKSECFRLLEADEATKALFWTTSRANRDKITEGYQLRAPTLEFNMPIVVPVLHSGLDAITVCGYLAYTTVASNSALKVVAEGKRDNAAGALIQILTADENLVQKAAPYETEYQLSTAAYFETFKALMPIPFFRREEKFIIRDYCFGLTYSQPVISELNFETVKTAALREPLSIEKYPFTEMTKFSIPRLQYTMYKKRVTDPDVHTGCGDLAYSLLMNQADTLWIEKDFETQIDKLTFFVNVDDLRPSLPHTQGGSQIHLAGEHPFSVLAKSSVV